MSIKFALLSLLSQHPRGVGKLRQVFEEQTDSTWPINVGQVYQTIQRLNRNQLIEAAGTESGGTGRNAEIYQITEKGRQELHSWWTTPTLKTRDDRDELVIKITMAALTGVNLHEITHRQRIAAMKELREITKLKANTEPELSAHRLLLERRIFELEAEVRWLDHIETLNLPEAPSL